MLLFPRIESLITNTTSMVRQRHDTSVWHLLVAIIPPSGITQTLQVQCAKDRTLQCDVYWMLLFSRYESINANTASIVRQRHDSSACHLLNATIPPSRITQCMLFHHRESKKLTVPIHEYGWVSSILEILKRAKTDNDLVCLFLEHY